MDPSSAATQRHTDTHTDTHIHTYTTMSIAKSGEYWTFFEDAQVFHFREDKLLGVYDVNNYAVKKVVAGPHVVLRLEGGNIDLTTNTLGVDVDEVKPTGTTSWSATRR